MIQFEIKKEPIQMTVSKATVVRAGEKPYEGPYEVTPRADEQQTLHTKNLTMKKDVTVRAVPYYEMDNQTGTTVYIASEV